MTEASAIELLRPTAPPGCAKMGLSMAADATPSRAEESLSERLRERDPEALRELYERCGRVSFGFLVKALGDRAAAEDVQQQVFLEVWRRAASYDPGRGSLLTWVMTIARSRAIDHLRRRVPEPVDPASAADAAEGGAPVEAEVEALAERWRMRALLDRLPGPESALLRMRFYQGLTQSEIAAREGIPLGTVKTRDRRRPRRRPRRRRARERRAARPIPGRRPRSRRAGPLLRALAARRGRPHDRARLLSGRRRRRGRGRAAAAGRALALPLLRRLAAGGDGDPAHSGVSVLRGPTSS